MHKRLKCLMIMRRVESLFFLISRQIPQGLAFGKIRQGDQVLPKGEYFLSIFSLINS